MPKDWVGWVASQRVHTKATKEDKILGNRIQYMERTERRQRRFAVKHLLITRTLLGASLLVILLMVNFLAEGLSVIALSLFSIVLFAAWTAIVGYMFVKK